MAQQWTAGQAGRIIEMGQRVAKGTTHLLALSSPLTVTAEDGLTIEKGSVDLLNSEVLSRPFTIFDQLLFSLGKEAAKNAKYLVPENQDFRPSKRAGDVFTKVRYEKGNSRVGVLFDRQ
jgi:hypothetical protein